MSPVLASEQPIISGSFKRASLNRCDQCAERRKGCDRLHPACKNCLKHGLQCTYSRKLQRNKLRSKEMDSNLFHFRISGTLNTESSISKSSCPIKKSPLTKEKKHKKHIEIKEATEKQDDQVILPSNDFIATQLRLFELQPTFIHSKEHKDYESLPEENENNFYNNNSNTSNNYNNNILLTNISYLNNLISSDEVQNQSLIYDEVQPPSYSKAHNALTILQNTLKNAPKRYRLINLYTLLQFPDLSKFNPQLNLFMTLAQNLTDEPLSKGYLLKPPKIGKLQLSKVPELLVKAQAIFFQNPNLFSAIGIERTFYSRPRTPLLNCAIWLSGLLLMEPDPIVECMIQNLTHQIRHHLIPLPTTPSLSTVQAIVILLVGINNIDFINRMQYALASLALDMAHALGLHLSQPHLDVQIQLERMLTYNSLLFYVNFTPLMTNILIMNSQPFSPNKKLLRYVMNHLKVTNPNLNKVVEVCSILFNQCLSHFNIYLCEIAQIKELLVDQGVLPHFELLANRAIEKLTSSCTPILQSFNQLKGQLTSPQAIKVVQTCIDAITFRCQYFKFFTSSLPLRHPSNSNISLPAIQSLETCVSVIQYGIKLNEHYNFFGSVGMTSACVIYLLRHLPALPLELLAPIATTVRDSHLHFINLKRIPFQTRLAALNLDLFKKVTENDPSLVCLLQPYLSGFM